MKEYRKINGTKMNAQSREWYHAHKDQVRQQRVAWAEKNRVELNAYKKAWRIAHPESTLATRAKRKDVDREIKKAHFHKYRTHYIWNNIRKRAEAMGRPFALTRDMITDMMMATTVCPVLGIELSYAAGRANDNSPSFDCFYPDRGYVPGNVHVISRRANTMKHNATLAEVQALVAWMEAITVVIEEQSE